MNDSILQSRDEETVILQELKKESWAGNTDSFLLVSKNSVGSCITWQHMISWLPNRRLINK